MGFAWRAVLVLAVAVAVGWATDQAVLAHATVIGAYQAQVRLGAATAGLFVAGAVATLVGLSMLLRGRPKN